MKKEFFLLSFLFFSGLCFFYFFSSENENTVVNSNTQEDYNNLVKDDLIENENLLFDIIRITKGGDAVMAGRAFPGKNIQLFDSDKKIADISSDANGEWVWSSETPLNAGTRSFYLIYVDENGNTMKSNNSITVFLDKSKITNPLVLKSSNEGKNNSEILNLERIDHGITLDVVEFSPKKKLMLSGRSAFSNNISIFTNDTLIGTTFAHSNGLWRFESKDEFEFNELNLMIRTKHQGKNIEVKTQIFANQMKNVDAGLKIKNVIVKPGNSLWRIARKTLGGGILYTEIYKQNINQIQDPDLIFPGQVFGIPIISTGILK